MRRRNGKNSKPRKGSKNAARTHLSTARIVSGLYQLLTSSIPAAQLKDGQTEGKCSITTKHREANPWCQRVIAQEWHIHADHLGVLRNALLDRKTSGRGEPQQPLRHIWGEKISESDDVGDDNECYASGYCRDTTPEYSAES